MQCAVQVLVVVTWSGGKSSSSGLWAPALVLRCAAVVCVSVVRAAAREEAVVRLQGLTTLGSRLISTVLELRPAQRNISQDV